MIFEGVNDIGNAANSASTQQQIGDNLIKAFTQIAGDAKKAGMVTIGATITPFSGQGQSYSGAEREKARNRVNKWILESKTFDHVVDFASMIVSKTKPEEIDPQYHGGDHLHPNAAGYKKMADGFPLEIFEAA